MNPRDRLTRADQRLASAMKNLAPEVQTVTLLAGILDTLIVIAEAQLATPPRRQVVGDGLDAAPGHDRVALPGPEELAERYARHWEYDSVNETSRRNAALALALILQDPT